MSNRLRHKNNSTALFPAVGALGLLVLSGTVSLAQESVLVDVGACVELETPEAQLECYNALVESELQARESDDAADLEDAADLPSTEAAPSTQAARSAAADNEVATAEPRTDDGPLTRAERREQRRAERREEREERDLGPEIIATVTELRELEPDSFVIYLDNNQVWRQNSPKRYNLREGVVIELRPSNWGSSYRLTDPNVGGFIQVDRVR